jgi:hypothetical protein
MKANLYNHSRHVLRTSVFSAEILVSVGKNACFTGVMGGVRYFINYLVIALSGNVTFPRCVDDRLLLSGIAAIICFLPESPQAGLRVTILSGSCVWCRSPDYPPTGNRYTCPLQADWPELRRMCFRVRSPGLTLTLFHPVYR